MLRALWIGHDSCLNLKKRKKSQSVYQNIHQITFQIGRRRTKNDVPSSFRCRFNTKSKKKVWQQLGIGAALTK